MWTEVCFWHWNRRKTIATLIGFSVEKPRTKQYKPQATNNVALQRKFSQSSLVPQHLSLSLALSIAWLVLGIPRIHLIVIMARSNQFQIGWCNSFSFFPLSVFISLSVSVSISVVLSLFSQFYGPCVCALNWPLMAHRVDISISIVMLAIKPFLLYFIRSFIIFIIIVARKMSSKGKFKCCNKPIKHKQSIDNQQQQKGGPSLCSATTTITTTTASYQICLAHNLQMLMIDFVSCNRCKLVCSCCSFSTLIDVKRPLSFSPIPPCPSSLPSWPYIVALDALASHTFLPSLAAQQQLQIDCNTLDCHIPCTRSRKVCHENHKICAIQLVS